MRHKYDGRLNLQMNLVKNFNERIEKLGRDFGVYVLFPRAEILGPEPVKGLAALFDCYEAGFKRNGLEHIKHPYAESEYQ